MGLSLLCLPLLAVPPQATPLIRPGPDTQMNLIGNGGVESWNNGNSFQGPIGPDGWYAMGDTSDVFTQNDIAFTRLEGCGPGGNGSVVMQIRANLPDNFVSQRMENFGEYAGEAVTFSLSVRPIFPVAKAHIEIDDGVSTSSALMQVNAGEWGRVTVRHTVAACPTKLEFRIYPEQTLNVDDAMVVLGRFAEARFVPRPNPEPALQEVPLGTVLDWYRFDASVPVPEGFAVCDGSLVSNVESPFVGRATPNLLDRFVRGVTSVAQIGTTGGTDSHIHFASSGENEGGHGSPPGDSWFMNANQPPPILLNARDGHHHDITVDSSSNVPRYVGLLKIIRIK